MSIRGVAFVMSLLACLFAPVAFARSEAYVPTTTIDAATLLGQLDAWRLAHPENKEAVYELAKAHCYIYAYSRTRFAVTPSREEGAPPVIAEKYPIPIRSAASRLPVSAERLEHLVACIEHLQNTSTGRLLYGYACREAAARCGESGWPNDRFTLQEGAFDSEAAYWEAEALKAFRSARAARGPEPKNLRPDFDYEPPVVLDSLIIYRVLSEKSSLTDEEREERSEVELEARDAMQRIYAPVEGSFEPTEPDRVPATAAQEAEKLYPPLSPAENGARYYLHALDSYTPFNFPVGISIPFTGSQTGVSGEFDTLSDDSIRVMEEYIDANAESLRLLHEAIGQHNFAFPVNFVTALGMTCPSLVGMEKLGELLAVEAALSCQRGDTALATSAVVALISSANSLRGQTDVTSVLRRIALLSTAVEVTQWICEGAQLSEGELKTLQDSFADAEVRGALEPVMAGERWASGLPVPKVDLRNEVVSRKITDINDPGNVNIPVSDEELAEAEKRLCQEWEAFQKPRLAMTEKYAELLKLPLPDLYEQVQGHGETQNAATLRGTEPFGLVTLAYIRSLVETRVAQSALAVALYRLRNGSLPKDLDDLVPSYLPRTATEDVFSGGSMRFEQREGGFVVYSEGYPSLNERTRRMNANAPSGISFMVRR